LSATAGLVQAPDAGSHTPAAWHWSDAAHTTAVPPHTPALQLSFRVQSWPSLHVVPSATGGLLQAPDAGSHTPATWHWSAAAHTTGAPPHLPALHPSFCVHSWPSSHAVPSAIAGLLQAPVFESQVPATWQWSDAAHTTGAPPHLPAVQTSFCVHASPSLHAAPSALTGFEQRPVTGLHVPATWHWSDAVQVTTVADWQRP